jgi:hypothetical protein
MNELRPTCFDCVHAQIDAGRPGDRWEPGEATSCDCGLYEQHQAYFDQLFDGQNDPAYQCQHFEPVMVEACAHCGEKIDRPAWAWHLFYFGTSISQPVCSQACYDELAEADGY